MFFTLFWLQQVFRETLQCTETFHLMLIIDAINKKLFVNRGHFFQIYPCLYMLILKIMAAFYEVRQILYGLDPSLAQNRSP